MSEVAFNGAKIAVLMGGQVLVFHRDDLPGLPFAGLWDLPGGARDGEESPQACALRETAEETALEVDPAWIVWRRCYANQKPGRRPVWMLVAEVPLGALGEPVLGDEGQAVAWMPVGEFLRRGDAIPHLQAQLGDYLRERAAREGSSHM